VRDGFGVFCDSIGYGEGLRLSVGTLQSENDILEGDYCSCYSFFWEVYNEVNGKEEVLDDMS